MSKSELKKKVVEFLEDNKTFGIWWNLISMGNYNGKFSILKSKFSQFIKLYCEAVMKGCVFGVAEKPGTSSGGYLPILIDIDIKLEEEKCVNENVYDEEQVKYLISIIHSAIKNLVQDVESKDLRVVLLEKSKRIIKTENGEKIYYKRGFHLHFPYIFLNKEDQEVYLIPMIKKIISDHGSDNMLSNLYEGSIDKLIDSNSVKVHWLMYGSSKDDTSLEPYTATCMYDENVEKISIEEGLADVEILDKDLDEKKDILELGVKFWLPLILSINPMNRYNPGELCKRIVLSETNVKIKSMTDEFVKPNFKGEVTSLISAELDYAEELLELLNSERVNDYNNWMTIGWILYNTGNGCERAYNLWNKYSQKCPDKYNEAVMITKWSKMKPGTKKLGSLVDLARSDNPEEFDKLKKKRVSSILNNIEVTHGFIANIIKELYGDRFICSNVEKENWWYFCDKYKIWNGEDSKVKLFNLIQDELLPHLIKNLEDQIKKIPTNLDMDIQNERTKKIRMKISNLSNKLQNHSFKNNVMKECCYKMFDGKFLKKLNMDRYKFAFKNGVYDLKTNQLREGYPHDYISKCADINLNEYNDSDQIILDLKKFLEQVFPDRELREYWIQEMSTIFEGGNFKKQVWFFTGPSGDNAKSTIIRLLELMLGPYAIKLPKSVLLGEKSRGQACPELSRAGDGCRFVSIDEIADTDQILETEFKSKSGGDSFFARDLYQSGKETKEIVPLFKMAIISNNLPTFQKLDLATINRIRIIEFSSRFIRPGSEEHVSDIWEEQLMQKKFPMDINFSEKLVKLVEPFAWLLINFRKSGVVIKEPKCVIKATDDYRKANDFFKKFTDDKIIYTGNSTDIIYKEELYDIISNWFKNYNKQKTPTIDSVVNYFNKAWGNIDETNTFWTGYRIKNAREKRPLIKKLEITSYDDE